MRLLWIYTLALAILVAFVLQDVNADAQHKKGAGNKGVVHGDGVEAHRHHPNVGRDGSVPGGRGDHHSPSGDRASPQNRGRDRGHSSSSDRSSHRDRKHKNKKQHKGKHNKHGQGKKHHRGGKHSQH